MGSPLTSTTGDASGTGPASASTASRGDDGGSAASSGGRSSAPASKSSASAAPKQGVDAADGDEPVSMPDTSAASAVMSSFPRGPHILSTAEVDGLFAPGQQLPGDVTSDVPSNWVDPKPAPEGQPFLHGELNGSWVRLRELLVNFQEGKAPPEDWDTIINVTAMDQRKAAIPDFSKRLAKVRFNQAAEAKKTARVLDLTRTGSGVAVSGDPAGDTKISGKTRLVVTPSSPAKPAKSSGKHRTRVPQDRPKSYTPGIDSVRPASAKSPVSKDVVHTLLPDGVVWEEVRPDLRLVLLAGLKYETAMKWLRTDKPAHSLFTGRPLVQMLVSMMYWRKLNQTPWASYVPETYFKMGEEELRRLQKSDEEPPVWEALDAHVPYPVSEPESTEDDPQKDPDFKASGDQESSSSDEESSGEESEGNSSASDDKESDDHSHAGTKRPRDYESSDTDDSGPIIPSKKSKRSSVHEAARSKSSSKKSGDASKSSPKHKKSGGSKSPKSSSGKQPSGKIRKSSLVSKPYTSLTPKELLTIEAPDTHCSSWLYYGIPVQPTSDTKTAIGQTPGFPDFEPHRHSLARLKKRWNSKKYQALLDEVPAPWEVMYQNRRTELYFHRREDLCPLVQADIEELASLMNKHAQALWERTHWVVMDPDADLLSGEQPKECGLRRASLLRQYRAAVSKVLKHKDFPETLMFEPGIWKVSDKYCPWIWQDPRAREIGGPKCLSLRNQLEAIDSAEPARTQWATASSDRDWMQLVPSDLRKQALTPSERAENPVSLK